MVSARKFFRKRRFSLIRGKTVLAVDDEPDVLDTIIEILDMCRIDTAASLQQAQDLFMSNRYDIAILDIMGVKGLDLLDIAVEHKVPSVMLTAPALNPEYILKAMERGAISYIPKEDLAKLDQLLNDLFGILKEGASPWKHTLQRLAPTLDEKYSDNWRIKYGSLFNDL